MVNAKGRGERLYRLGVLLPLRAGQGCSLFFTLGANDLRVLLGILLANFYRFWCRRLQVKCPLFFMLGAKDRRVPQEDARQYVHALRARLDAPETRQVAAGRGKSAIHGGIEERDTFGRAAAPPRGWGAPPRAQRGSVRGGSVFR